MISAVYACRLAAAPLQLCSLHRRSDLQLSKEQKHLASGMLCLLNQLKSLSFYPGHYGAVRKLPAAQQMYSSLTELCAMAALTTAAYPMLDNIATPAPLIR